MNSENQQPHRCPSCSSESVRRSRRRLLDRLRFAADELPYRCRACRRRFWLRSPQEARQTPRPSQRAESRRRRRALRLREFFVFAVALLFFVIMVLAATREPA